MVHGIRCSAMMYSQLTRRNHSLPQTSRSFRENKIDSTCGIRSTVHRGWSLSDHTREHLLSNYKPFTDSIFNPYTALQGIYHCGYFPTEAHMIKSLNKSQKIIKLVNVKLEIWLHQTPGPQLHTLPLPAIQQMGLNWASACTDRCKWKHQNIWKRKSILICAE